MKTINSYEEFIETYSQVLKEKFGQFISELNKLDNFPTLEIDEYIQAEVKPEDLITAFNIVFDSSLTESDLNTCDEFRSLVYNHIDISKL